MGYSRLIVYRDGVLKNNNYTASTYIDPDILVPNTGYLYKFIPYDLEGIVGSTVYKVFYTLPDLASLTVSGEPTSSQIILQYTGNYTTVNITRNGISIATGITTSTYIDNGLTSNTSYTYVVTPIGQSNSSGVFLTITQSTLFIPGELPVITSFVVSSETSSQIVLSYSGNYTNLSITRNGTPIPLATNITGTTFTDTGLTANTSYIYIATPYNSLGDAGSISIVATSTLPNILSFSVSSSTVAQIVLSYSGNYTSVSITRNGISIAANITGTTFTDTGLTVNTSYTYIITPYNSIGAGLSSSLVKVTLPNIISLSIPSVSDNEIVLLYSGNYTNVSISRNGTLIATNITGTTFTDTGLTGNTSYIYIITPYNSSNEAGIIAIITQKTLPNLLSLSVSSYTATQIVLSYSGNYTSVSITRDGTSIATNVIGTTYTDIGLLSNTSYTYMVTPYNSAGTGTAITITNVTLPNITSIGISSGETNTQTILSYSGNYTSVSITRNGTSIATNITGTTFTDTGLTANTSYTYVVTPKNSVGTTGTASSITYNTLGLISSVSVTNETASQVSFLFSGNYTSLSITRDGTTIATNITGTTYTDSSGLTASILYTYIIIPYNLNGVAGTTISINVTLPNITTFGIYGATDTEIVLILSGNYTNVDIYRDASLIATQITGTIYTDTGLSPNTSYTYFITSYNSIGELITSSSITQQTLPSSPIIGIVSVSSTTAVSVAFTQPSGGTGTITGYTVTSSPGGLIVTGVSSPISVSGLTPNTVYTFTVSSTNSGGTSALSASSTVTTKPNAPIISDTTVSSSTTVSVVFTTPIGTGTITGYTVTSSLGDITTGVSSPITVSGLTPNTLYRFTVSATNSGGTSVASEASILISTIPGSPTIGTVTVLNANSVNVNFTAPSGTGTITGYTVSSNPEGLIWTGVSSPITVLGLIANTEYTFTVTATNSGGTSLASIASSEVSTIPNAPIMGAATALSTTAVSVAFTTPSGGNGTITGYTVTSSLGDIATGISSPITVLGLIANTSYTFTVTATNISGTSSQSSSSSVTTKPNAPIIGISTVLSSTTVSVGFTESIGGNGTITGYTVTSSPGGLIGTGSISPITVSGLTPNTVYTFTVSATNTSGTSLPSVESSTVTTIPSAPTINITESVSNVNNISVAFTQPSGGNGTITNYTVTSSLGDIATSTFSPITVFGLTANTQYIFTVTSTNSGGTSVASSSSTLTTKPNTPTIGTAIILNANSVSVGFISPSGTGIISSYTVISNLGDIATGSSSPITVSGLTANTSYTFTVSATNSGGTSDYSIASTPVTTIPNSPIIGTATITSSTTASVYFTPPSGGNGTITGYTVSSQNGLIGIGSFSPITIIGLSSNTSYTFTVTATNSGGISSPSSLSNLITTIPSTPIIGSSTVLSSSSVSVSFTAPSGTETISYTVISNLGDIATGSSSPIIVSGLTANTPYTFTVTATNSAGTSVSSSATILVYTKPNAPIIGVATVLDANSVSVGFTPPSGVITGYIVTSSPDGLIGTGTSSPIIVSGLSGNTSYTFTVTASNSSGTSISSDSSSSVTTIPSPPDMGIVSITSTTAVSVAFTVPSGTGIITGYTVSGSSGSITAGTSSPITVSGLTANTSYTFTITATNSSGTSISSSTSSLVTTNPNAPIIGVATVLNTTDISVSFTSPSGSGTITNYTVTSSPGGLTGTGTTSPITVSGLTPNTPYTFSVFATNSSGSSVSSNATTSVTTIPDSPTINTVTVLGSTSVSVSFTPPSGTGTITSYTVTGSSGSITTGTSSPISITGLVANTEYIFTITATNSGGTSVSSLLSSPAITSSVLSSLSVFSKTDGRIVLRYSGSYTNVSISRNGITIVENISGTTYTDSGLSPNISYIYIVTPYNLIGVSGSTLSITEITLPNITSVSVSSDLITSQIVLTYAGSYTNVSISRDGTTIATNITATTYTDSSGITSNTSYAYVVTPYNSNGEVGITSAITYNILGLFSFVSVSGKDTEIDLAYSGSYTNVSITRNGTTIATNITGTTYTDSGLTLNTPYTYIITPFDSNGNAGMVSTITQNTINTDTSSAFGIFCNSETQITLLFGINSMIMNISRNGTIIVVDPSGLAMDLSGSYIDAGLSSNTSYTYVVSSATSSSSITQSTLPSAPIISVATILSSTAVSVAFTPPSGTITSFTVTSSPGGLTGTGASSPITVSGLTANTIYTFVVSASNSNTGLTSNASSTSSAVTTVPSPPIIGTASVSSTTAVSVAFTPPSGGNGTITGYTVISSPGGLTATGTTSPITVSGLTANTIYTFTVTATNSGGTSVASSASTSVTTISGSPTIGTGTVLSSTAVNVAFTAPSGTGNITGYAVTSSPGGLTGTGTTSPITVSGLTANTIYTFTVTATNSSGTSVASSASTSVTTRPSAPIIGTTTVSSANSVSVPFIAPTEGDGTITGYIVTSSPGGLTGTGTTSPITVSGLSSNTIYTFTVTATNSGGTSVPSNASTAITTITGSPTIGTASVSSTTSVSVNFTAPSGTGTIIGYTVTSSLGDIITGLSSPITVLGLTANTIYTFSVTATNSGGTSVASSASNAVTTKPEAPLMGIATVSSSTAVSVAFTSPSGTGTITSYTVISSPGSLTGTGTTSPISVTGLTPNTIYTFTVTATNSGGTSVASNASSAVTTQTIAPTIGTATVSNSTEVSIVFTPPNGGNGTITGYTVTSSPGGLIGTGTSSPISVTGLSSNTIYTFTVTATNSGGISASSGATTAVTTISSSPTIGTATVSSSTTISVAFTAPSGTGTITGYTVTSSPGGLIGTGTTSPISVSGLTQNTPYTFTVTATNSGGTSVASSSSSSVTTLTNPPTIGVATISSATSVSVSFTSPGGTDNLIFTVSSSPGGLTGTGTTSPITVSGLISNTIYTFSVTATNSSGTSISSGATTAITTVSSSPTIGTATVSSSTTISVDFTPPTGTGTITGYTVTSSPGGLTGTGTTSPITVSGLTPNTSYTFTVTATNSGGTSVASSASNAVTTKPEAPIIGTVTVSSTTSVSVSFTASSGTGTITSYTVTSSLGDISSGTSSPITVSGLNANTSYTFTVTATNSGGTSVSSSASTAVITTPNPPTINNVIVSSSTTVSVVFTAPNGTGTITGYTVTSSPGGLTGTGTTSPITVSGLTPNTPYTFSVTATNSSGTSSSSSASTEITTIPTSPTIGVASVLNSTVVSVSFTPSSGGTGTITGYTVTSSSGGLTGTGTTSPITVSGLSPNTIYTFTVTATNSGGISLPSSTSNTVTTKPSSPIIGSATVLSTTEISVVFTPSSGGTGTITGYTITSSPGGLTGTGTSSPITVSGLTPNTSYIFTATATNSGGTSIPSNASTSVTTIPNPPTIGVASVLSTTAVSVVFTPPSGGTGTLTSYTVTSSPGGLTGTGTTSPISVSGLTPNTPYTFSVTVTNSGGTSASSSASTTVITLPEAPIIGSATVIDAYSVSVVFTPPSGSGSLSYTITSSLGGLTGTGTSSPITVSGLASNTAYTFTVIATNSSGSSIASGSSSSITTLPDPPTIIDITVLSETEVSVEFTEQIGGTGSVYYTVVSSPGGLTGTGTTSPIIVSELESNTVYTFIVTAYN